MPEDVYVRLRQFLDGLPGGFPETDSGVEYKLLERYFTPEEAEIAMTLSQAPETVAAIAARTGMDEAELAPKLEKMATEGSIYRVRFGDEPYYMALHFLVGIYEFHLNAMDRELSELADEYLPYLARTWGDVETKPLRVVPIAESLDTDGAVATYDQVRELVKGQSKIAVAECICRKEKQLLDRGCEHPLESCITFSFAADYYIENGMGREIDLEECMKILDATEKAGMVLAPSNSQNVMNLCTCCGDSCNFLRGLKMFERPADHASSNFQASVDPELCVSCEVCVERCQMEAIVEGDDAMEVDLARCIGCGLCVPTCSEQAMSLVPKAAVKEPAENYVAMQMRLSAERGLT